MLRNCQFFKIGHHLFIVGDTTHQIKIGDLLHHQKNSFRVVAMGRQFLNTPKNRMGLCVEPMNSSVILNDGVDLQIITM